VNLLYVSADLFRSGPSNCGSSLQSTCAQAVHRIPRILASFVHLHMTVVPVSILNDTDRASKPPDIIVFVTPLKSCM